jgi:hypothetical protein
MVHHFSLKTFSVKFFIFPLFQIFSIAGFAQPDSIKFIHAISVDIQSNGIIIEWQTPKEVLSGVYYTMEGKNSANFMVASALYGIILTLFSASYPSQLILCSSFSAIHWRRYALGVISITGTDVESAIFRKE